MKHLLSILVFCIITTVSFSVAASVSADNHCGFGGYDCSSGNYSAEAGGRVASKSGFVPLVGIPYVNTQDSNLSLAGYVDALYKAAISIAAFMAVVKIIFAGVKYMLSDVVTSKEDAKKDIRGALIGLLIVIGAVLILNTINPQSKWITSTLRGPPGLNLDLGTRMTSPVTDVQ